MPVRIGLLLYPLVPIILVATQRGPVSAFYRAGAISPDTARRAQTIKAKGDLDAAVRRGLLVRTDDGLHYVNVAAYRRNVRFLWIVFGVITLAFAAMLLLLWQPWRL